MVGPDPYRRGRHPLRQADRPRQRRLGRAVLCQRQALLERAARGNETGTLLSTDAGESWNWLGGTTIEKDLLNFSEATLAQRTGGSLWMVIRTKAGLYESTSTDDGRTWSQAAAMSKFAGPATRACMRKLASGAFVLIYHDSPNSKPARQRLTAWLSDDEGRTWPHQLLLDERTRVSYPDATQAPDGRLFIAYDHGRYATGEKEVLLSIVREEDVRAGKLVSQDARTKLLVNQCTGYGNTNDLRLKAQAAAEGEAQAAEDAKHDRTTLIFDGQSPNKLACDTTLRAMPDGSWVMVMLGGGDTEPRPQNGIFLTRSTDQGQTWSPMEPVDLGFKREGDTAAMVPSELMVRGAAMHAVFLDPRRPLRRLEIVAHAQRRFLPHLEPSRSRCRAGCTIARSSAITSSRATGASSCRSSITSVNRRARPCRPRRRNGGPSTPAIRATACS